MSIKIVAHPKNRRLSVQKCINHDNKTIVFGRMVETYERIAKNIIVNCINVGGVFGFNEDNLIIINKESWELVDHNSKEVSYER